MSVDWSSEETSGNLLQAAICYEQQQKKEDALFTALCAKLGFSLHKGIINTAQQRCGRRSQLEWVERKTAAHLRVP